MKEEEEGEEKKIEKERKVTQALIREKRSHEKNLLGTVSENVDQMSMMLSIISK